MTELDPVIFIGWLLTGIAWFAIWYGWRMAGLILGSSPRTVMTGVESRSAAVGIRHGWRGRFAP